MPKNFKYILLTILLITASQAAGQYSIDTVCVGSVGYYRVDGEPGSVYTWSLTDPLGNGTKLSSMADTVAITWSMVPGIYQLSTVQHSPVTNCDAVLEIGSIVVHNPIIPVFAAIGPLCRNSTAPDLKAVSTNGIPGTWSPAMISTNSTGISSYVFSPEAGRCAVNDTLIIEITNQVTAIFDSIGPLCQNSIAPPLPSASVNGVTGTWMPPSINTTLIGITAYTFTPDTGQCAVAGLLSVEITNQIIPVFDSVGPFCKNSTPPELTAISTNGISGTWEPPAINTTVTGTSNYTFTPAAGQCSVPVTMAMVVTDQIIPTFASLGPLCLNSPGSALPTTSTNGITGFWVLSDITTDTIGITNYTFTPDPGQCGVVVTMGIEVTDQIAPVFTPITPVCLNSIPPPLPVISINGITGHWQPAAIRTDTIGTTQFTFTPDAGQCATNTTTGIEVTDRITPAFEAIGPLCQNSIPPPLPATSDNGITGTWSPASISTTSGGTTTYTFTPALGQCAVVVSMDIHIINQVIPVFEHLGPLCLKSSSSALPTTSLNGITGYWVLAAITTDSVGITNYTFTPSPGQCGVVVTMGIDVYNDVTPEFDPIGPLCLNSSPPVLPTTSKNNITGSWSSAVINTGSVGTTSYTFTPDLGQCGLSVIMNIEITTRIAPEFEAIGPFCMNSTPPDLPATSINGITGTWQPAAINTTIAGTTTYTFTPGTDQCSQSLTLEVTVMPRIIPAFAAIGPLEQNSTPPVLPDTSVNGFTGKWNPAMIKTMIPGTTTYTFTPDSVPCGVAYSMDVTVTPLLLPTITIATNQNPICKGTFVTFTATVTNHGINPVYAWLKNGIHVGHSQLVYQDSTLKDKDVISCNLVSRIKDGTFVTVWSTEISMTVYTVKAAFTINENLNKVNGNVLLINGSTGANNYYWDFGDGHTSTDVDPSVTFTESGIYLIKLTATNQVNCTDTMSYQYDMMFKGLYIPNAFAPNATTTLGGVFKPIGINLRKFKVEVYDNWGHLMWESSALDNYGAPTESWDGTYHGKPMPQGTYLWKVHAVFFDDTIWNGSDNGTGKGSEMGTVLLIR